ncbi:MAG: P-loop NTPase fold protein [Bacteroidota bacterium]
MFKLFKKIIKRVVSKLTPNKMQNQPTFSLSKNEKTKEYLDYYLDLKNDPLFAVLLKGTWGAGKTWFIKNYLDTRKQNKYLYVSLNGIQSIKEIEQAFYIQMHPILSSKGVKYAKTLVKGILKSTIKVDLDGDPTKNSSDVSFTIPEINSSDYNKIENRILVFDDLERCQMDIKSALGYINEFVENSGFKVIILADESKIISEETENDPKKYSLIKEKTIGKSFEVISEVNEALDVFVKLISSGAGEILNNNKDFILETYTTANYNNLRHLRHAILNFDLFYGFLPHKRILNKDFIEIVVRQFFALSFEISAGFINARQITELLGSGRMIALSMLTTGTDSEMSNVQKTYQKYDVLKHRQHPINGELWREFFETGSVNSEELVNCIENSFFFLEEKKPNWVKLFNYRKLNQDKFEEFSDLVIKEFNLKKIKEKFELVQTTGLLCELSKEGLINFEIDMIISSSYEQLIELNKTTDLVSNSQFPGDHSHGLKFAGFDVEEFKIFLKFAREQEYLLIEKELPPKALKLFALMKTNFDQFQEELNDQRNQNRFFETPILKEITVLDLMDWIKSTGINDLMNLSIALAVRYDSHERTKTKLLPELTWLTELSEQIVHYKQVSGKFVSYRIEKDVLPNLNQSIKILTEVSAREELQSKG